MLHVLNRARIQSWIVGFVVAIGLVLVALTWTVSCVNAESCVVSSGQLQQVYTQPSTSYDYTPSIPLLKSYY